MWNYDMTSAPKDSRIWAATKCGKVIVANWSESRKAWAGFASKEQPLCWQPYMVPSHPEAS